MTVTWRFFAQGHRPVSGGLMHYADRMSVDEIRHQPDELSNKDAIARKISSSIEELATQGKSFSGYNTSRSKAG